MTREEQIITYAKKHYYDDINCFNAFIHGVGWAELHPVDVWHEASEKPKDNFVPILYQNNFGTCWVSHKRKKTPFNLDWEYFVSVSRMVRWAYISDLLPKTK